MNKLIGQKKNCLENFWLQQLNRQHIQWCLSLAWFCWVGLNPNFCCTRREGEDSRVKGGRGGFDVWYAGTSDGEHCEVPACSGWFCHVAYCIHTCWKGIEKYTPVLGPHCGSDLHTSQQEGWCSSCSCAKPETMFSYLNLCCLDAQTLNPFLIPLFSLGITLCI